MPLTPQNVLIAGTWRAAAVTTTFQAANPRTREAMPEVYPESAWSDVNAALEAAGAAFVRMREQPDEVRARFLELYADLIEKHAEALCTMAHHETALAFSPRLREVELPRTTGQLRQAAAAARDGSWVLATIDRKANIRSYLAPLGPVAVFGPNNFPLAFNSVAGGDFAAAIAAGNPVIAKANPAHPATTRMLAELAHLAAGEAGLPAGAVQLIYRVSHADGERLVSDLRLQATGYTGARGAGLKLKAAADRTGRLFYAELSSINPVVILPGALAERGEKIAEEFTASCLLGTGQFCTNPGLVVLIRNPLSDRFIAEVAARFTAAPVGTLLGANVQNALSEAVQTIYEAGAQIVAGGTTGGRVGYSHENTLLRVNGSVFLDHPHRMQTEAFGNASLVVVADDLAQAEAVLATLEGNLTGCIYSDTQGSDDAAAERIAFVLRPKVGRLLNDKMPTGVAVSPAMNHGGPFPATSHPHFTAVGIPASLRRFTMLQCFDNVRANRLPRCLQDKNPTGHMFRQIDGAWSQADV